MFIMALTLALLSAAIELLVVFKFRIVLNFVGRWLLAGLCLSLAISVLVGVLFGAGGLVVTVAALMSTMMTLPVYWIWDLARRFRGRFERGVS